MGIIYPSTDPAFNRVQIEHYLGQEVAEIGAGSALVDRAVRLVSKSAIVGSNVAQTLIDNKTTSSPWGNSSSVQAWAGHDFWIGYCDGFSVQPSSKNAILFDDQAEESRYQPSTLVWTWQFTQTGIAVGPPSQNKVKSLSGKMAKLVDPVPFIHNAACWTTSGIRPTSATEGQRIFKTYDPTPSSLVGTVILISDGQQIANEARGELRRIVSVREQEFSIDKPLRNSYKSAELIAAPVNAITDIVLRDLTIGKGLIGWSFFGKFIVNAEFRGVVFDGVCEIIHGMDVTFTNCTFKGGLKLNNCHRVRVLHSSLVRVSYEENCSDIEIDGFTLTGVDQLPGITCDQGQKCERLSIRNGVIRNVVDCPFVLDGKECLVENVVVDCDLNSAHCYITGERSGIYGLSSSRGVVFKNGLNQWANSISAPGVSFGWYNEICSGTAKNILSPKIDNIGNRWTIL